MCIRDRLEATVQTHGKRTGYVITPEAFRALYTRHLSELLAEKRIPSVALFEAFYNYCFVPKHTIGAQLLTVRRDKRERAAFAATQNGAESEEEDDETQERFRISFGGDMDSAEAVSYTHLNTATHRETLKTNGFSFCPVDIMDADGDAMLPIPGMREYLDAPSSSALPRYTPGKHLTEIAVGKDLLNYDSLLVYTHFKGHTMGGFGGSLKNIAIGCSSGKVGKLRCV